jgi:hypothetical protein
MEFLNNLGGLGTEYEKVVVPARGRQAIDSCLSWAS